MLAGKHVALYVSGGIAAYKAAYLVRELIRQGAEVRVVETAGAQAFVTPLTFQTLSKHAVYTDRFAQLAPDEVAHIELADWTEIALVAPATADLIAKMAQGLADDFASTALLATTAPKFVAPAMNVHMWENPATQRNVATLKADGVEIIEPATGFLAEGYSGKGRFPEPTAIVAAVTAKLLAQATDLPLHGQSVLVTAGGTRERLDPVRYLTNDSSGKMGYALATAARDLGAQVTLISAPTMLTVPAGVAYVGVDSAEAMRSALLARYQTAQMVIMAAAVADFRPVTVADNKIKKTTADYTLTLTKNPDILAELGQQKQQQFLIGFAAETQHLLTYAQKKLASKRVDMIVANDVASAHAGFNHDTNEVTILQPNVEPQTLPLASKQVIAQQILQIALATRQDKLQK
ncbi:phosphopantothenoylcysteine decarboxylase [Loigolactobacillus coryniformis subsp. coryniformis]|uniref:Coenzyme A biosynthesis bifunctional protein CoaBC n=1 Tax=Loigolactobacillus coryniformis subsp. coryniformis KCTC 3167 = DSM 20001 TaxID=913848 RepID=A0A0R1FAE6_9LACO|nr:bifunctional phosphopantothenoylcysteine decarboxylase/phosphopantothenate--cysteine ligase CoaBC [Loigolactobacillus coryniformis]ATO55659.1 phosphopantothenoylcysteine decarboxylase [Loigolactobacillus coryniformis subsp. coryniformis KCTC 3167 = DSM 20001]KRK18681.1 coenzyme A biosynthesis bifunctional protein CoaBC [Loigolactobacillus coryniformis subsp. coryniformis KCTC 3167 = DSM 20001]OEH90431.1 phosphopantothenoylcysteine decarboxylase [Loigolactobacillus coryniformis subsp. corynifo